MANDLNLCQFIGHLGRDPETKYLPSGDAVTNFSLAVGWKGKEKEGTEWVRCNAFGKAAEIAGKYLAKGKQCYVAGRMSTRECTDKDGQKRYTTEINVDRLQLLGSKDDGERNEQPRQAKPKPAQSFDDTDDDIPW
jgi:single-strand DNA-binding protein